MALKIKLHEASPRKFRQDPSTRGVGGKWGPVGEDPMIAAKTARAASVASWGKDGLDDTLFKSTLERELFKENSPWVPTYYSVDNFMWFETEASDILGFFIAGSNTQNVDGTSVGENGPYKGIERLLNTICKKISASCSLNFIDSDEHDGWSLITCAVSGPDADDPRVTRKTTAEFMVNELKRVTAYLKKMAPTIKREMDRDFKVLN